MTTSVTIWLKQWLSIRNSVQESINIYSNADPPLLSPCLLVSSAENLCKQFWTQIRPNETSGPILIQTVWHSGGIPERIFRKSWFWKISRRPKEHEKLPSRQRVMQSICESRAAGRTNKPIRCHPFVWWLLEPGTHKNAINMVSLMCTLYKC